MNFLSLVIGIIALPGALIAFIPFFGWMYWFILPIAVLGLVFGVLSHTKAGRNLNLIVLVVGTLRLMLGGGVF